MHCRAKLLTSCWPGRGERKIDGDGAGEESQKEIKRVRKRRVQRGDIFFLGTLPWPCLQQRSLGWGDTLHIRTQHFNRGNKTVPPFPWMVMCCETGQLAATLPAWAQREAAVVSLTSPGVKPTLVGGANPASLSGVCVSGCCREPHPVSFDASHSRTEILPLLLQPIWEAFLAPLVVTNMVFFLKQKLCISTLSLRAAYALVYYIWIDLQIFWSKHISVSVSAPERAFCCLMMAKIT